MSAPKMDEAAALAECEKRWPGFAVWTRRTLNPRAPFQVGITVHDGRGSKRRMMGCGLSWERAFLSADRRMTDPSRGRRARAPKAKKTKLLEQLGMLDMRPAQGCADATLHRG